MSEKGQTVKPLNSVCRPKTWMIWLRLNCLKPSGEFVTRPHLTQRFTSGSSSSDEEIARRETLLLGTGVSETLSSHEQAAYVILHVSHDCTAGLPTGRES
jgi:hypothetical protein